MAMNLGQQHLHARTRIFSKLEPFPSKDAFKRFLDYFMYAVGIAQPLALVPQAIDVVVHHQIAGASPVTWGLLGVIGCFWVLYGIVHREMPIVFSNVLSVILDFVIAVGVLR